MFHYTKITVGQSQANAYILYDDARDDAVLIDPGAEAEGITLALSGKKLTAILLTHGHSDHIDAVEDLRSADAPVYIHEGDAAFLTNPKLSLATMIGGKESQGEPDFCIDEGELTLAGLAINVLHTPGHTRGSCCFLVGDVLFSGDTLFKAGIGRTDLPGGNENALYQSLQRLLALDEDVTVLPGHGGKTKIASERRHFP